MEAQRRLTTTMAPKNLEEVLQAAGNTVAMLRNSPIGAYVYPVVPSEYSNWRDEQKAWRDTAVLFDQSHHMANLYVEGPDALKLLSYLGTNSFANFPVNRAKQFAPCSYDGFVIGDGILFHLEQNSLVFVGRAPTANWLEFHATSGKYDVKVKRDDRSPSNPGGRPVIRTCYRYQIQGPNAKQIIEKLNGGPFPEIKFFKMGEIKIKGRTVRALRHGMAGAPGLEIWGPYEERDEIRAAIVEAGKDLGLKEVGSRAYASNTLESGWIPSPLPAVYTGEKMKSYRQWLPANSYEATGSLAGSFVSNNIEDYYLTPWDLGYGPIVKFDHEFVGRAALEKMASGPHRKKVTLALDSNEVTHALNTLFNKTDRAKYFDFPSAVYATLPYDKVMSDGKTVGVSTWCGYSSNEGRMLTLAILKEEYAEPGTEVTFVWGEENGGSKKPTVERHVQTKIRATVSPVPYSEVARTQYAEGWRTHQEVARRK